MNSSKVPAPNTGSGANSGASSEVCPEACSEVCPDANPNACPDAANEMSACAKNITPGLVSFVGAGPGDPELLTIKGRKAIEQASLVIYAGSLVPPDVVACAAPGVPVVDSAPLTLEQCHDLVRRTALTGGAVARVHTGDPSLYGALREQARLLDQDGIPWRVIPGVTAACAAAAAAGVTFTVPEVTQSLIITRMEGRTPVPEREALRLLAAHGTSLAVYLSAGASENLQAELLAHTPPDTPVLCAYRVGWPDQRLVWTTAGTLAQCVEEHGLVRQTVFLVLPGQNAADTASLLYAAKFSHGYRQASKD